jgi:hypothetical protein
MNRKTIIITAIGILIFVGLVFYNYLVAQRRIRETRPSPLEITLESYPETVISGKNGAFIWNIDSSPDLSTNKTTIYWGYNASPSALTQNDSPEAVGYSYHQDDYFNGIFKLPDTFDLNIKFTEPGKIYFRAYAKVGDNHLWTEEKAINIISNNKNVSQ